MALGAQPYAVDHRIRPRGQLFSKSWLRLLRLVVFWPGVEAWAVVWGQDRAKITDWRSFSEAVRSPVRVGAKAQ